jgi:hypothetical protein
MYPPAGYPNYPMGYGYPPAGYYQPPMYPQQMYQPPMYQPQAYPRPMYYGPANYNPTAISTPRTNLDRSVPQAANTPSSSGGAPAATGTSSNSTAPAPADPSVPRQLPSGGGANPLTSAPPAKSLPAVPMAPPGSSTPIGDALPPSMPGYQGDEDWPHYTGGGGAGKEDGASGHLPKELMIGDIGWNAWRLATSNSGATVRVPLSGMGSFKASDDDSPRPMTRVYGGYDYFNNITDGAGGHPYMLHRETAGFEYAFLDGRVSVGARVPMFHQIGDGFNQNQVGDVTAILKVAPYLCKDNGNVITLGVAVTAPTGPQYDLADGTHISPTLIEPFIAGMYNIDRFYVMGFSSITAPTSPQDVTLWSNDVGVGYRLYQCTDEHRLVTGISPTIEWHLNTPMNHAGLNNPGTVLTFPNEVFLMTGGVQFMVRERGVLTVGAATPICGPKPYDVQGIFQFNLLF